MPFERYHWRHYFGGVALLLLLFQFLTGVFLTLFYQPHLVEAYASVQQLYKDGFSIGAWFRDSHRWISFFLFFSLVVHTVRSLLRKEFLNFENRSRTIWLTGCLLMLPVGALLVTGFILPWEWKAYWFMEMVPNYFSVIPYIGAPLKQFLIDAFTLNRNFVAHVVILPVVLIVLVDLHIFSKVRRRSGGIPRYFLKHLVLTVPFIFIIAALAIYIPMPTQDPDIIPMPMEGALIPQPEWFYLVFLVPFMYFKGAMGPFLGLYLGFSLYLVLMFLPYMFGRERKKLEKHEPGGDAFFKEFRYLMGKVFKVGFVRKLASFLVVFVVVGALFGLLFVTTSQSPTLGCNSCHNTSMGTGIGIPPDHFKDRSQEPKLEDSKWMLEHWFYPNLVW